MKFENKAQQYEWWTEAVRKIQSHQTSIRAGCRELGIQFWQYYEWKERVQSFVDRGEVELSAEEAASKPKGRQIEKRLSFIEVVDSVSTNPASLTLHFKDCWHLEIPEDFNPSVLACVVKTLRDLP